MDGTLPTLPRTGPAREALRRKGQFWTPDWVAGPMVAWAVQETESLLDVGVGAGAFARAAHRLAASRGRAVAVHGYETDADALRASDLDDATLARIRPTDFMSAPPEERFPAIVSNPPYLRHHRFAPEAKAALRAFATCLVGTELDGRAGLHVFFLLKALTLLEESGRLAFILPADTFEGRFAPTLWRWIAAHYRIEGVATFAPEATPFPGVDTNAVIVLIRRAPPAPALAWARVLRPGTEELAEWCRDGLPVRDTPDLAVRERSLAEAIATGLSRPPPHTDDADTVPLGAFIRTMRGIATGENDFFFMTSERLRALDLPRGAFLRAIGRTRDHAGETLTLADLDALDRAGRPTFLLSLPAGTLDSFPEPVRDYLRQGAALGLPERPLIAQRKPWFRMERRAPPTWLFAYLGRRRCRFVRNRADAVPLTGFLCLYPRAPLDLPAFTSVLNDERTLANLHRVAKSYGGGALKVEPRNLERLPVPRAVLRDHGIAEPGAETLL